MEMWLKIDIFFVTLHANSKYKVIFMLNWSHYFPITDPTLIFFVVLCIILLAPIVMSRLRIPHIIGMVLAGVVVGQYGLNILERDSSFELFGKVGLLYIMFLAGLEMNLTEVEYTFDNSKIVFYFTAEGRVDFRELVKDLSSTFHTRIELRQIGVRDEAKMVGGLGVCGRPFCCSTFLNDFHSVSIKMVKDQGLSLSPTKISGCCGRLMCCLKYEQNSYEYLNKITPRVGSTVEWGRNNRGKVVDAAVLTGNLKVMPDDAPEGSVPVSLTRDEVKLVKNK